MPGSLASDKCIEKEEARMTKKFYNKEKKEWHSFWTETQEILYWGLVRWSRDLSYHLLYSAELEVHLPSSAKKQPIQLLDQRVRLLLFIIAPALGKLPCDGSLYKEFIKPLLIIL